MVFALGIRVGDQACTGLHAGELKLTNVRVETTSGAPRTILAIDDEGVVVGCGEESLRIVELQRPGRPRTPAAAIARGLGWRAGDRLP